MSFLGNIFGSGSSSAPRIQATSPNFSSSGYTGAFTPGVGYSLSRTGPLSDTIGSLQSTFSQAASAFGGLARKVAPGFSMFRKAGLTDLANTNAANISNLSQNLAQRRVLGSSFANASISQANADYEKNRSDFIANSYLQEISASQQLIQQEFTAKANEFKVGIDQMNLEASLAAQLTTNASSSMNQIATAQAQLDEKNAEANAQGLGKLLGMGLGLVGNIMAPGIGGALGGALGGLLGGGGGGTSDNPI